jgi:hypothetical protein
MQILTAKDGSLQLSLDLIINNEKSRLEEIWVLQTELRRWLSKR